MGKGDTPALMAEDALRAGAGHCNPAAVRILAEEGPDAVRAAVIVANAAWANRQSVGCHYRE